MRRTAWACRPLVRSPCEGTAATPCLPWLLNATDSTFDAEVRASVPVPVDFWAAWCGPCRVVAPVLEDLTREHAGRLKVVKLDMDRNSTVSRRYAVRSLPTLMLFREGRPPETWVGALSRPALSDCLAPYLGRA